MKIGLVSYSSSNTANVKRLFEKVFNQRLIKRFINKTRYTNFARVGNFEFVKTI